MAEASGEPAWVSRSRVPATGISTVRSMALKPAFSALSTRLLVALNSGLRYSWNHLGPSGAARAMSSSEMEERVLNAAIMPALLAALAVAASASGWISPWLAVGET